jgi:4-amino-4-deoxy-L-arabinose transferase-like glycosyltransferase
VMNDMAVAFFSAAAIYCSFRVMKGDSWKWLLAAAASLSLGFLTEASMAVAAGVCALTLLLSPLSWRRRAIALGLLAVAPIAVAGWFYIGNLMEYGQIYPMNAIRESIPGFGGGLGLDHENYRGLFQSFLDRSYWYVGGYMSVEVVDAMYQFLDILAGMAIGGTILVIVRRDLSQFQQRGILLLSVLLLGTILMIVGHSVVNSWGPQGRFLFGAQPAIALLLALGLMALFQRDTSRDNAAAFLLPVILLGLNLGILTMTLPTAY